MTAAPSRPPAVRTAVLLGLGGAGVLVLLEALAPAVTGLAPYALVGVLASTLVFLAATGAVLAAAAQRPLAPTWAVLLLAVGAAADVALNLWPPGYPLAELGVTLALLLVAVGGGGLLARGIGELNRALPVGLVIAVVDLWSVLAPRGVTRQIVEDFEAGESRLLGFLLATYPVLGQFAVRSGLGVTDLIFVATFLGLLRRADRPLLASLLAMAAGLLAALLLGGVLAAPVPALPFLAVAFLAVNWRAMRLSPAEWRQTLGFLGVLALLLVGVSLLRQLVAP